MVFGLSVALLVAAGGAYAFPMQGPNAGNSTGCYKAKCRLPEPPPCPSPGVGQNRFGFSGEQTATFAQNGPLATLSPNIHWTYDTKPAVNVVPIPSSEGSQMYYGVGDPTKHGAFAFLTYYFSAPSVNLDHCDHVSEVVYDTEILTVRFATEQAYGFAVDTWVANDNLILIAFAKGCGDYVQGERCYFQVLDLDFSAPGLVLRATGRPSHPDDIITSGETEWGYWAPKKSTNQRPYEPVNTGAPFAWSGSPTMQAGAGSGSGASRPVATSYVSGAQPSLTDQPGSGSGLGSGFGSGSSPGSGASTGSGSGTGAGSGIGAGSGTGSGTGSGSGTGTDSSADQGSGSGSGSSSNPEPSPGAGSNSGSSSGSDTVSVPGGGSGASSGSDPNAATGLVSGTQPNPTDSSQPPNLNPAAPSGPDGPPNPVNPDQLAAPSAASGPVPSIAPDGTLNSGLSAPRVCVAPVDTRYGLPTACLGDLFDEDLDNGLMYAPLPPETLQFVLEVAPDFLEESVPGALDIDLDLDPNDPNWRTRQRHRKRIFGGLARAFNRYVVQPIKKVYKVVQQATAIPGSINKEINWKLPNPQSANPADNAIKDPSVKQAQSPWGDAMLLKSFTATQQNVNGFMNVYCVGCGVQGNAKIAGRAKWTPLGGFIEGQVELRTDVRFVLKIGVDAEIVYSRTFTSDLLNVGLPGLSYGVVTIGPRISVGTRVELNAAAKGRLLAGAEMGLQDAHVLIDFVDSSKSTKGGWEPYFKPVFEAQGELMLSASLGLPIGIKCGLQISSWDKSVGIIDEPSIKGVAQAAATIGNSAGVFAGGFTETNGCTGISTQISWRNRLYIDIFGTRQIPLLDTNDRPLARNCIALPAAPPPAAPAAPAGPAGPASDPPTPGDPAAPADPISDPTQPQTPTDSVPPTDPAAPATPPPADPVAAPANDPPPATDDANLMFRNRRQAEGDVSEVAAGAQAGTSSQLSYDAEPVGNNPYFDSAGREFAMLVDPDGETMVVSCSNGNLYPVRADSPDSPDCSELWATADDVLVYDGAQRLMHYYNNTMGPLGVSRLRVEAELEAPAGSVVVFWAPYYDPQAPDEYLFVAIDPLDQVFYPVVCDYADGTASKVFLAQDPVAGVETLQSPDVVYSITGGRVSACYALVLNQGTRQ